MAGTTTVLRRAGTVDADRIAELSGQLGYPAGAADIRERLLRLENRADQRVFVAEDAGRVIGWIHAAEHLALESGDRCEIVGLVVDRGAREHGIGRRLVDEAERWARARGMTLMSVRSAITRVEPHPFYLRLGYQRIKTSHTYRKSLASGEAAGDG